MRSFSRKIFQITVTAVALGLAAGRVSAQTLLVGNGQGDYQTNTYGGSVFGAMTGMLKTAFANQVTPLSDLSNTAQVLSFSRLWLDQRLNGSLSTAERNNVAAFIATGRRVVMIGENQYWDPAWNPQLVSLVGGSLGAATCFYDTTTPTYTGQLTSGVNSLYLPCARQVVGGTSLFKFQFATLWGANQNVLTIFDANLMDDNYIADADNRRFSQNVATWLAGSSTVVPEPSTFVLLGSALMLGGVALRRRRRQ